MADADESPRLALTTDWRSRLRAAPWLAIGSLALLALFLSPARGAALRGDDEWTFELRGQLGLAHRTLANQIWSDITVSIQHLRPQVLAKVSSDAALYYFQGHPALYRLYLIVLTIVCAGLLWALIRRLGGSGPLAALTILIFAGAVQFRAYHDAMLGYYGATQFAIAFVLASLLAMLKSLQDGGRRWVVLAAVLFACACGMQEYIYPLAAIHLCLAFTQRRGWRAVRAALPVITIGVLLMAAGYLGRNGAASGTDAVPTGYGTSLSPHLFLASYLTQLFPPLPGSNRLFSEGPIAYFYLLGSSPTPAELLAGAWRGLVVFGGVVWFGWWLERSGGTSRVSPGLPSRLVAVGIPLWLTPPILVAVSQKYQQELTAGKGYVDVLLQVVAFALVTSALLILLIRVAERRSRSAVLATVLGAAVLLGLGAGVDGFNNLRVVAIEQPVRQTRDLLETSAGDGIFDSVPQRSTLLFSAHDMAWPTGSWEYGGDTGEDVLYGDSHRNYDVRFAADDPALEPLNCGAPPPTFPPPACSAPETSAAWVRVRARPGGGVVIVSQITRPTVATIKTAPTTSIYVYTEAGGVHHQPPLLNAKLPSGAGWWSGSLRWTKVGSGHGWAIYHATVKPADAPVAWSLNWLPSPVDFLAPITPDRDVRIFGTKGLLP